MSSTRSSTVVARVGQKVRLVLPDNKRLDGLLATVEFVTEWGAHVSIDGHPGRVFRALFSEMGLEKPSATRSVTTYTGDLCDICGSSRMLRGGNCATCQDCGTTTGC